MTQSSRPVGPGDHVFLVDGSSFIFRAYFQSIRQDAKYNYRADQLPTGAVRLFCNKLFQFVREGAAGVNATALGTIFSNAGKFVPARNLSPLQGQSLRAARRSDPAISADARRCARLRPRAD